MAIGRGWLLPAPDSDAAESSTGSGLSSGSKVAKEMLEMGVRVGESVLISGLGASVLQADNPTINSKIVPI
jgi:hypothetical protein